MEETRNPRSELMSAAGAGGGPAVVAEAGVCARAHAAPPSNNTTPSRTTRCQAAKSASSPLVRCAGRDTYAAAIPVSMSFCLPLLYLRARARPRAAVERPLIMVVALRCTLTDSTRSSAHSEAIGHGTRRTL